MDKEGKRKMKRRKYLGHTFTPYTPAVKLFNTTQKSKPTVVILYQRKKGGGGGRGGRKRRREEGYSQEGLIWHRVSDQ